MTSDAKARAAATYNAASDGYDDPALSFWDRFGRRTVERLDLAPGSGVLDVCCGSGASAIPAAERVGAHGRVLAVDLSAGLLALARAKAERRRLTNIEFRLGDLESLGLPSDHFDAVICVFGIFFIPEMTAAARELWRMVRPGGSIALTTWGQGVFEPMNSIFWDSIGAERPDLHKGFNPWDRISEPDSLRQLLLDAGVTEPECIAEAGEHPLATPDDWWRIVMGSGYRWTVDQLDPAARDRVRQRNLSHARAADIRSINAGVVYGSGRKPRSFNPS